MYRMFSFMAACAFAIAAPAGASILNFDGAAAENACPLSYNACKMGGLTFKSNDNHGVWLPSPDHHAQNGTQVFENGFADLKIKATDGGTFTLNGFDFGVGVYFDDRFVSEDDVHFDVDFILHLADGTKQTITRDATTDFQHIDFGGVEVKKLVISADYGWIALDNFQYAGRAVHASDPGAVPEPASWAMMLGGFGLVGGALRRRRMQVLAA